MEPKINNEIKVACWGTDDKLLLPYKRNKHEESSLCHPHPFILAMNASRMPGATAAILLA